MIENIYNIEIFEWHFLLWLNKTSDFKFIKIDNRFYIKYSIYIGPLILEIGKLKNPKHGTNY